MSVLGTETHQTAFKHSFEFQLAPLQLGLLPRAAAAANATPVAADFSNTPPRGERGSAAANRGAEASARGV
jgi:hypothetical protein